ncbi:MAG: adenylyltransferase/cytidyltransferase family protein [Epsilonproteobacteria bacterium]|nr:adenylyltransferase/cytidyltransferase family protein [Campylobacterota bacterium]OIO16579.1 MAG: ADP-heptose synthase [Helicobacteraceae bacterium CG1_02_36_14]PIP11078.1 MAG: ADP-heptose synthase [Sulfurimonas sp. CG23_combo_of_CG06-09_8_20_14_all_36_33]PIS24174.1 MAG: ADP-heptose synthase [Sulfurimonas sp. CG08_land_8_20_14_0_20_36_33]PIU33793.1 MAG: ADP-heptose synthase [Sulfurimonas sp. CG07_land_8_20_14_0_80_36_56]PIV04331.1 MAG: ADP-heptose synthase [Sulfurimonas sp. CG03_land_8_20_1
MKKVFVYGDFNILHPGHLRLLKFAKESGDYLVVGVNSDNVSQKGISQDVRLESIRATSYVDDSFILDVSAVVYIEKNRPDIVVKGKEYASRYNPELEIIKSYGGKLLFSSGEIGFSSMDLLKKEFFSSNYQVNQNFSYLERHHFKLPQLKSIVEKFSALNILVIGDTIVDEYITCEALGMSQEDPTIVVSPLATNKFIGGAAIVASHAATLGANVKFFSVAGDDENRAYVQNGLKELGIDVFLYTDTTRPTTLKQRFRASGKTLLRVNHLKQHALSSDIENLLLDELTKSIKDIDLIIFSDFSYGVLTKNLIENIANLGLENSILMSADSQSSSQVGDISKFKNMTLVTPTEREIRLSLNDFESGLVVLSDKLVEVSNAKYIFTTLGAEGMMIYNSTQDKLLTDNINALGNIVKDVSGAGDSLLTCSSMALAVGASIWEAAYLGSLASAIQVSRVGNVPIKKDEILKEFE